MSNNIYLDIHSDKPWIVNGIRKSKAEFVAYLVRISAPNWSKDANKYRRRYGNLFAWTKRPRSRYK